ncbi:peptidoglycan DD-metalloendopeptidase family protein [Maribacter flavus]|uniref:Peptidoglycan DD-metalloendopeptidase family protein n=1 Tax=Maribacter flavus TaxID=1658664 RepID=A0A5B2TUD3_9FLAO|nr:peptidoglycan DD-metalloendopeptidase family protein [Maribacter flavus]KAA2218106.1 peptidoglycan DD-metalloendopeptidase family protein [Maribacter flavus]
MNVLEQLLFSYSEKSIPILDEALPIANYVSLDLSSSNSDLNGVNITDPNECQFYIDSILKRQGGKVAHGGYLEQRNLYADKSGFNGKTQSPRNIHLGIDYWAPAGTKVINPLDGVVHSFKNNATRGDYGPTIILQHSIQGLVFYTLYGHLSLESLDGLSVGKEFAVGSVLASLGTEDINVNYAPHLHFQVIQDLEGYEGDYPGVCAQVDLDFYKKNCPDPNLLLKI